VTFDYVVINHQKVEIESESMPVGFCWNNVKENLKNQWFKSRKV
jgi:hypothetical protein